MEWVLLMENGLEINHKLILGWYQIYKGFSTFERRVGTRLAGVSLMPPTHDVLHLLNGTGKCTAVHPLHLLGAGVEWIPSTRRIRSLPPAL